MTENLPTTLRRRVLFAFPAAIGAGGASSAALASTGRQTHIHLSAPVRLAAVSVPTAGGADQAALRYVDGRYRKPGAAHVVKSEPDVDRVVPACDVRVVAPSGTTHVVHVRQFSDAVHRQPGRASGGATARDGDNRDNDDDIREPARPTTRRTGRSLQPSCPHRIASGRHDAVMTHERRHQ